LLPDDAHAGIASIVFSRSRRFDGLLADRATDVAQLVLLGAGLDTRCHGALADQGLAMFELDQAAVQRAKRKAVKRAGLPSDHVNYLEVDFAQPQWIASLLASS
jgi:O-methyltransferase involved in polyketide biosynthesis